MKTLDSVEGFVWLLRRRYVLPDGPHRAAQVDRLPGVLHSLGEADHVTTGGGDGSCVTSAHGRNSISSDILTERATSEGIQP
jgi:hypothetical protein